MKERCLDRFELPAEPGFARREPYARRLAANEKEGAHGGTMGSPMEG
jgi:hypothetical protein